VKIKYTPTKRELEWMRKPGRLTEAQCKEKDMTVKERNVFDAIDMWWKEFGYGPSYDDIMRITGDKGRGNVHRVIDNLVKLGVCKKIKGKDRSVRPVYIKFSELA
jgi:SOS-response transcriptional repressor LexA